MGYSGRKVTGSYRTFLLAVIVFASYFIAVIVALTLKDDQTKERQEQNIEAHCLSVSAQDPSITVSEASILKADCIEDLINAEKIINNIQ